MGVGEVSGCRDQMTTCQIVILDVEEDEKRTRRGVRTHVIDLHSKDTAKQPILMNRRADVPPRPSRLPMVWGGG